MRALTAFCMALSLYTALPIPWRVWREEVQDWLICCLAPVGLVLGALWAGAAALCQRLSLPASLAAFFIAALPFLLTGFFHLDGFLDTCDAVLSRRDRETRLAILKDSRVGAFAVISFGLLLLLQYAAASALAQRSFAARGLLFVPAASRSAAALAVTLAPPLPHSQYRARKPAGKGKIAILLSEWALAVLGGFFLAGREGLLLTLGTVLFYSVALGYAAHDLGGVSGDLSGFAQTLAECGALVLAALIL